MAEVFIPIFTEITSQDDINYMDAGVFGAVWFYSFQGEGACSRSPETIAEVLSVSPNTIRASLKRLKENGYIEDLTPEVMNATHKLRPTKRALALLPPEKRLPEFGNQDTVTAPEIEPEVTRNCEPRLPEFGNDNNLKESLKDTTTNAPMREKEFREEMEKFRQRIARNFGPLTNDPKQKGYAMTCDIKDQIKRHGLAYCDQVLTTFEVDRQNGNEKTYGYYKTMLNGDNGNGHHNGQGSPASGQRRTHGKTRGARYKAKSNTADKQASIVIIGSE